MRKNEKHYDVTIITTKGAELTYGLTACNQREAVKAVKKIHETNEAKRTKSPLFKSAGDYVKVINMKVK